MGAGSQMQGEQCQYINKMSAEVDSGRNRHYHLYAGGAKILRPFLKKWEWAG